MQKNFSGLFGLGYGKLNFAAGSGEATSTDEQGSLIAVAFSWLALRSVGFPALILAETMAKDYMDQTIPNAAYNLGWIVANTLLKGFGWKTGEIRSYKECSVND